jgi:hypothetical protein
MPLLNYPNVCTAPSSYGKAFCKEHCDVVEKAGYPSDIRAFLQSCSSGQEMSGNKLSTILAILIRPL